MDRLNITHQAKRKGFNLIEAAIVLGVVGLVIGGIWVAASAVMENIKVNKTVEGVFTIARNAQNLISRADSAAMGAIDMVPMFINAKIVPEDWVFGDAVKNPLGEKLYFTNKPIGGYLIIGTKNASIPKGVCVKMLTKISSAGAMAGSRGSGSYARTSLGFAYTSDGVTGEYTSNFPISPQAADSMCFDVNSNIAFGFGYTRIN